MYLELMFVLFMVSVGLFVFQLQDINTYKQQVNYQIERKGGLTTEAIEELNDYSSNNYKGRYKVSSKSSQTKQPFGTSVEYTVVATIPISIFPVPDFVMEFEGNSVSQIR